MAQITFDKVPEALGEVLQRLGSIEQLLSNQQQPQPQEQDQLLTIQQAGELLNLSVPTIYGLVSRSDIPHSKKGKRLYFSKQELLAWVQSGRRKTTSEIQAEASTYKTHKPR